MRRVRLLCESNILPWVEQQRRSKEHKSMKPVKSLLPSFSRCCKSKVADHSEMRCSRAG